MLQFSYKVSHLVECISVPTNLNDAVNNAMLNISMDVIANFLKLPWHLSIDSNQAKVKSYASTVASINGIFYNTFYLCLQTWTINIYSAFLRLVTEPHNGSVQHYTPGDFRVLEEKYHKIKDVYKWWLIRTLLRSLAGCKAKVHQPGSKFLQLA